MDIKQCKVCGETKPLSEFVTYSAGGYSGYRGLCRACDHAKWYAVRQAHKRRYYDENRNGCADRAKAKALLEYRGDKAKWYKRITAYDRRHPERLAAKRAVMVAVRAGRLIPSPCEVCGKIAEAHHDDYSRPLDVRWLCRTHHAEHHRLARRKQDTGLRPGTSLLIEGREWKAWPKERK